MKTLPSIATLVAVQTFIDGLAQWVVRNRRVRARTTEVAGRGQRVLVGSWFEGKYCAQVTS